MEIKEFAIVYDEDNRTWIATHNMERHEVNKNTQIYVCGDSPEKVLNILISKLNQLKGDRVYNILQNAAKAMHDVIIAINNVNDKGNPVVELSFKEGDVGIINEELLGMYMLQWFPEEGGEDLYDRNRFVLCVIDGMEISFKTKLFTDKQLSQIEIIDHVDSYDEYLEKCSGLLKTKGLI